MRVAARIILPVPPEDAWRIITAWEDQARWMKDVYAVRVPSDHREGLGVRLAARTRVFGVPLFTDWLEVTLWEPPRRLVVAHQGFVRGVGRWTLDPDPSGTRFTWLEDVSLPVPLLGELALFVYRPFMRRLIRGALANLQAFVRSEST
ncbi:MAG: SRPBCC family protein [Actinomycetota bacterium]